MKLTAYERETIINYNIADCEATVYTHDKKADNTPGEASSEIPGRISAERSQPQWRCDLYLPKKYITVREPYSEARRQAARERALNGHFQPPRRDTNP